MQPMFFFGECFLFRLFFRFAFSIFHPACISSAMAEKLIAATNAELSMQKPETTASLNNHQGDDAEEFEEEQEYFDEEDEEEFFKDDDNEELRHSTAADLVAKFHNRINLAPINMPTNVATSVKQHEKKEETGRFLFIFFC